MNIELSDLATWLRGKVVDAERTLKTREEMARILRTGTDAQWIAAAAMHPSTVGQSQSKSARLKEADRHDRIAVKLRHEVEMFKATLALVLKP